MERFVVQGRCSTPLSQFVEFQSAFSVNSFLMNLVLQKFTWRPTDLLASFNSKNICCNSSLVEKTMMSSSNLS